MLRANGGEREDKGLVSRVGPLEIDWPKSIGYYGGIGVAVACELIAPPIAIFIAAVPILKLFKHPGQPWPWPPAPIRDELQRRGKLGKHAAGNGREGERLREVVVTTTVTL